MSKFRTHLGLFFVTINSVKLDVTEVEFREVLGLRKDAISSSID